MTDETGQKLTPAHQRALSALLAGQTVTQAASDAGVGRRTVHEWLRTDSFSQAYQAGLARLREALQCQLLSIAHTACDRPSGRGRAATCRPV